MKRMFLFLLLLSCLVGSATLCLGEDSSYTEKAFPLYRSREYSGTVMLRFYRYAPNVAYMGLNAYCELQRGYSLTVSPQEDGTCLLTSPTGGQVTADPKTSVLSSPDWPLFRDPPLPWQGGIMGMLDSGLDFIRITDVICSAPSVDTVFDLGKYGIQLFADENDVYLPLSTISNLMCEGADRYALLSGESVLFENINLESLLPPMYCSEELIELFNGKERPRDVIAQSYADICLSFDTMFGYPGVAPLDEAMKEKGLHQALLDLGSEGAFLIERLNSTDYTEYFLAFTELVNTYLNDGHTQLLSLDLMFSEEWYARYPDLFYSVSMPAYMLYLQNNEGMSRVQAGDDIETARQDAWGNEIYHEMGNIAVIRLDDFEFDTHGWRSYYDGDEDIPQDSFGRALTGLRRASQNPDIDTILFDVTTNGGGSTDVLMAILSLMTDQRELTGTQGMTGQEFAVVFETDKNLDGVFDEKDDEIQYNYKLAVLTSSYSFSAANDFAFRMRQNGALILGEPTGGGSCCIQIEVTQDGLIWVMSSYIMGGTDEGGLDMEEGCPVDITIPHAENRFSLFSRSASVLEYSSFFDPDVLMPLINDWFSAQEADKAA